MKSGVLGKSFLPLEHFSVTNQGKLADELNANFDPVNSILSCFASLYAA